WIQTGHAGVEDDLSPELTASKIVLTNLQRIHGPNTADQTFALLLALTRGVRGAKDGGGLQELHGKTMLVVGLGGIGTQVARRAHAFGMRVIAIDPKDMERPACVFSVDKPAKLMELLPKADVVVLACPLTPETRGLIGADQLKAMKKSAYLVNIAR